MKSIIFAVIYCSVVLLNISFGQVTFSKYYTNPLNGLDVSNNLILDDSILIYPFAGLNTFNWQQLVIARLNSFGDVLVQKEYGDTMEWIVPQASLFLNDNYYVGCYHANAFNSQESIGLMKIDKNLDTIWFKKYAFDTLFEYINQSILLCADGGILISA
nr:hypothetical protein [Bacteroidota bacterium]